MLILTDSFLKRELKPLGKYFTIKVFGENLSLNNKRGKALILKMLDLVMDDIKHGCYQKETVA